VHRDTAAGKALDGFAVAGIGCLAVAQQRAGAGRDPQSPLGPAGPCSLVQLPGRGSRGIGFAGSDVGLDKLDQRPAEQAQIIMSACPLRDGERAVIAAKTVVQHRRC
jgi:hypothetical protein